MWDYDKEIAEVGDPTDSEVSLAHPDKVRLPVSYWLVLADFGETFYHGLGQRTVLLIVFPSNSTEVIS